MGGDLRSAFSNHGSCVDIFAPGRDIKSASHKSDTGTAVKSGTSQATPLVAGAVALLLAHQNLSVREVSTLLAEGATDDLVTEPGKGSPNKILYVGPGFETLGDEVELFEPVNGGTNMACRGRNEADGDIFSEMWAKYWGTSAYEVEYVDTLEACKNVCLESKSCTGVEYKFQGNFFGGAGRCEIWVRDIGCTKEETGFECHKYNR